MFKRIIAILMLALLILPCTPAGAYSWGKPSTEELQDEARLLGEEVIGGTAEVIHTGNYRASATEYSEKVGIALEGEVYEIIGYYLNSNGRSWIQIDWDGFVVWVSASLVRCSVSNALDARYVSASSLIGTQIRIVAGCARVRSGAGTDYYTMGYVNKDERYQVLNARASSTNKIWYQIRVDGRLGWISSGIAENTSYTGSRPDATTSASTAGNTQAYPAGQTCTIIAQSANARSAAGTSYPVVAYVYQGERYTVLAVDTAANGKKWYQVRVDGVKCWISSGVTNLN